MNLSISKKTRRHGKRGLPGQNRPHRDRVFIWLSSYSKHSRLTYGGVQSGWSFSRCRHSRLSHCSEVCRFKCNGNSVKDTAGLANTTFMLNKVFSLTQFCVTKKSARNSTVTPVAHSPRFVQSFTLSGFLCLIKFKLTGVQGVQHQPSSESTLLLQDFHSEQTPVCKL